LLVGSLLLGSAPAQKPSKEMAQAVAAYAAKVTASALFVSGRTLESVKEQELRPVRPIEQLVMPLLRIDVDDEAQSVTVTLGVGKATAVHRRGRGCVLVPADDTTELVAPPAVPKPPGAGPRFPPPEPRRVIFGERDADGIDRDALRDAIDAAFVEEHEQRPIHTRAVVVLHDGAVVGERYADGFHRDMPLPGWSMSKSLTNALLGMRAQAGKFDVDAPPAVAAWRERDDARGEISVRDLLTMTAGLQWSEDYDDPESHALRMLFRESDTAALYASLPPAFAPGTHFQYASGATNLLCRLLRDTFDDDAAYWEHAPRLFAKLGMRHAVLETDASGTFVGSSFGYASARDWAQLGLLYLDDGVHGGERVLPEGWVAKSTTPHPASNGRYGWQIWLNADPDGDGPKQRLWPDLPADLFHFDGHEGQYVAVSPSKRLVIVRLGCTKAGGFRLTKLLRDVHAAVRE